MDVTRVVPRAGFVVAVAMVLALATASAATGQSVVSHDNPYATIRYTDAASSVDRIVVATENDGSDNWYSFATTPPGRRAISRHQL